MRVVPFGQSDAFCAFQNSPVLTRGGGRSSFSDKSPVDEFFAQKNEVKTKVAIILGGIAAASTLAVLGIRGKFSKLFSFIKTPKIDLSLDSQVLKLKKGKKLFVECKDGVLQNSKLVDKKGNIIFSKKYNYTPEGFVHIKTRDANDKLLGTYTSNRRNIFETKKIDVDTNTVSEQKLIRKVKDGIIDIDSNQYRESEGKEVLVSRTKQHFDVERPENNTLYRNILGNREVQL